MRTPPAVIATEAFDEAHPRQTEALQVIQGAAADDATADDECVKVCGVQQCDLPVDITSAAGSRRLRGVSTSWWKTPI